MNKYTISLNDLSIKELNAKFIALEDNYNSIKTYLISSMENWKKSAEKTITLIGSPSSD